MLAVSIEGERVRFGKTFALSFLRTLRIPDDGRVYPLPPGIAPFPIRAVADYADRVPSEWREAGGIFIPVYQREALWLDFHAASWRPNAVKIGVGGVNSVSGRRWDLELHPDPQDYVVCPDQPWLDGINAGDGHIRQFVAMPLGEGYTVEGQLLGLEQQGGMQVVVFDPKPGRFPDMPPPQPEVASDSFEAFNESPPPRGMGLGAGGRMRQKIYPDRYGIDVWDQEQYGELFVHICNSEQYEELTGEPPPPTPVSARVYTEFGLPWFDLYDEDKPGLPAATALSGVHSVDEVDQSLGRPSQGEAPFEIDETQISRGPKKEQKP